MFGNTINSSIGVVLFCVFCACSNGTPPAKNPGKETTPQFTLNSPRNNTQLTDGQVVAVDFSNYTAPYDSAVISFDDRQWQHPDSRFEFTPKVKRYGAKTLSVRLFLEGKITGQAQAGIHIFPSQAPLQYSYKVINTYPHDDEAYTQGLLFKNNILYESTGLYGHSSLRKTDLKSGTVKQIENLEARYFGEGIALLNNLIYQLTWRESVCNIYDAGTLTLQHQVNYAGEGWGLTDDGKQLIMSNGSHFIRFMSALDLKPQKQLEVCTPQGYVAQLNELELIEGELWANIYTTHLIARIDTSSGAVLGFIHLDGVLPTALRTAHTDVLNGIAYDAERKRIFVTGKNWKQLFEIKPVNP
jgi:glutamine cyclotransferase